MLAVLPIRRGELPLGGDEAVVEAGGRCLLVGSGCADAAQALRGLAVEIICWEVGAFSAAAWASGLAEVFDTLLGDGEIVILPANPDGRDLAPRLAVALGWPVVSWAHRVEPGRAVVALHDGRSEHDVRFDGSAVVTLRPGCRGVVRDAPAAPDPTIIERALPQAADAQLVADIPPDPSTMDLAEARRIVAGGAGLGGPADFARLAELGAAIGASLGATRVATDAGWTDAFRQIGTTGVTVDPVLYLAFGISGAVQHVMGLGDPAHVVSVNLDPSCPMMALADLAVVTDARALLPHLQELLAAAGSNGEAEENR
ncbi:MAG: mycofactocin-associated electron transfer flavoprotein alpha subunit [Acidimicrobiales bacterium]|nr:mycofactocin-associated electron transfer flavoprotein alpha subunit [Acidimicrobiales bacterium]